MLSMKMIGGQNMTNDKRWEIAAWEPIDLWEKSGNELIKIKELEPVIKAYIDTLLDYTVEDFMETPIVRWDEAMKYNMGGGLPIEGFYEIKKAVYEYANKLSPH